MIIPAFASVAKPMQESPILSVFEIPAYTGMSTTAIKFLIKVTLLLEVMGLLFKMDSNLSAYYLKLKKILIFL